MVKIGNYEYSERAAVLLEVDRRRGMELMISERTGIGYFDVIIYEDFRVEIGKKWKRDYSKLKNDELETIVEQIILDYTFNT